jgi:hypothetical protein
MNEQLIVLTPAGYTPGWCTVPVPINGSTQHTGKLPADEHTLDATVTTDLRQTASEYRSTYKADPSNYHPPGRTGGGFWFEERQRKAAGALLMQQLLKLL